MTGFGSASGPMGGRVITADVRSINAKFLDLSFRLPPRWDHLEWPLAKVVRSRVFRGKVAVSVYWSGNGAAGGSLAKSLCRAYARQLRALRPGPVTREDILRASAAGLGTPGGFSMEGDAAVCVPLVERALDELIRSRDTEGKAIRAEFAAQLDAVSDCMSQVEGLVPEVARETQRRLETALGRLGEAGDEVLADRDRVSREVALLLLRSDAREEVVRVHAHVAAWRERMDSPGPQGKMLEFLLQEIQRELNTLAAKTTLLEVTRLTLAARALVDQMREQVANVE